MKTKEIVKKVQEVEQVSPIPKAQFVKRRTFLHRKTIFQIVLGSFTLAFSVLTFFAKQHAYFPLDVTLTRFIQRVETGWIDILLRWITIFGNPPFAIGLTFAAALLFAVRKRIRESIFILLSTGGAALISVIFKFIVARPRPDPDLIRQLDIFLHNDSFPSGHVLFYVSLYGFLLYVVATKFKKNILRIVLLILFTLLLLLIGPSRMYVGAHWFSDTMGAYLIGSVWLFVVTYLYNKAHKQEKVHVNWRLLLSVIFLFLIMFFAYHVIPQKDLVKVFSFPKDILLYLCILSFIATIAKAVRFKFLLEKIGIKGTYWQVIKAYTASQVTTPLPAGEALRGVLFKQEFNKPASVITGPIIIQPFLELFSAAAYAIGFSLLIGILRVPSIIAALLTGLLLILFLSRRLFKKVQTGVRFSKKLTILVKQLKTIQITMRKNILDANNHLNHTFIKTYFMAFFTNCIVGLMIYIILQTVGVTDINFFESLFIYTATLLITAIAGILPGGLGLTEGGMAGILLAMSIPFDKAIVAVIIYRAVSLIFYMLIGLLFFLLFYYKKIIADK